MRSSRSLVVVLLGALLAACTAPNIMAGAPDAATTVTCDGPCPCAADTACGGATPRCDKNTGRCVACLPTADNCTNGTRCVGSGDIYGCMAVCTTAADCPKSDAAASVACCNSVCIDTSADISNCGGCGKMCAALPNATVVCAAGACALGSCTGGFANCDDVLANGCEAAISSDPKNCGACGKSCGAGANATAACTGGACVTTCAAGFADCRMTGSCDVVLASDPMNCGACNMVCAPAANASVGCSNSVCSVTNCKFGFADCDKNPSNGCEADLTSTQNCGACGDVCAVPANATAACNAGQCGIGMCDVNYGDCNGNPADGCERSLANDLANCGACNHACSAQNATPECLGGQCGIAACNTNYNDCDKNPADGCESNKLVDPMNCGACGNACAAPANAMATCQNGACGGYACNAGYADCDNNAANGCESNLATPAHCGGCNNVCATPANATAGCNNGQCGIGACNSGYADCDNNLADGCEKAVFADVANCGGCGKVCMLANAQPACLNGQCGVASCSAGYADCDMNPANGCESQSAGDLKNCGSCGHACNAGDVCSGGICNCPTCNLPNAGAECVNNQCQLGQCHAGYADCDHVSANGCEVDTATDAMNCGGCGMACPMVTPRCVNSQCVVACAAGTADCDHVAANGCEVNTNTDPNNCGACGVTCGAQQVCTAGACVLPVSCNDLHTGRPALASGIYSIDTDGAGVRAPFSVYCDMSVSGGGWTLVGRSQPGGNVNIMNGICYIPNALDSFGWGSARGSLQDDTNAYSLDAFDAGLGFTEVLIGDYAQAKQWGSNIYRIPLGANYIATYANTDLPLANVVTVMGACTNPSGLSYAGYTSIANEFHFRDNSGPGWGLYSDGWRTCYNSCSGDDINGLQGMIFVR